MVAPPPHPGYTLTWSDTFDGPAGNLPSPANWLIKQNGPNAGNNEIQTYTNSPTNVSLTGSSTLQILPQKLPSGAWTSARIETIPTFSCPAGSRMILQASLQNGTAPQSSQAGIWPAFWALGASIRSGTPWPQCGEWDIMENAHGVPWTLASLHYGPDGNQAHERSGGGNVGSTAKKGFKAGTFNTFGLTVDRTAANWEEQSLSWSLNGAAWFVVRGSEVGDPGLWENCSAKAYYAVLNVAVGSNFPAVGGRPDGFTVSGLGSGMQVEYVAVYTSVVGGGWKVGGSGKEETQKPVGEEGMAEGENMLKQPVGTVG